MIDAHAVVEQIRASTAPTSWQVTRANRSYFIWSALGGVALAVGAVGAAIYLSLSSTIVGIGVNDQTPDNVAFFWFVVDRLVLAAFAIGGVIYAIRRARAIGSADEQMLVLMPEGFVRRTGAADKDVLAVNYGNLATITPSVRNGTQYLDMRTKAGKRVSIELDGRFGSAKALARQIAGQHAHYVTTLAGSHQG